MKNKQLCGIGGNAGVGKDYLTNILISVLKSEYDLKAVRIALADELKDITRPLILEQYNIDILNCSREDKNIVRPFLVEYAKNKRRETQGKYWTSKAQYKIDETDADIIIISDIRYDEYPEDEVFWLKKLNNGFLIHISKFDWVEENNQWLKQYVKPANNEEELNDPKIKLKSNVSFEWESGDDCDSLVMELAGKIFDEYLYKNNKDE